MKFCQCSPKHKPAERDCCLTAQAASHFALLTLVLEEQHVLTPQALRLNPLSKVSTSRPKTGFDHPPGNPEKLNRKVSNPTFAKRYPRHWPPLGVS